MAVTISGFSLAGSSVLGLLLGGAMLVVAPLSLLVPQCVAACAAVIAAVIGAIELVSAPDRRRSWLALIGGLLLAAVIVAPVVALFVAAWNPAA